VVVDVDEEGVLSEEELGSARGVVLVTRDEGDLVGFTALERLVEEEVLEEGTCEEVVRVEEVTTTVVDSDTEVCVGFGTCPCPWVDDVTALEGPPVFCRGEIAW
jgi:hypothetical protein